MNSIIPMAKLVTMNNQQEIGHLKDKVDHLMKYLIINREDRYLVDYQKRQRL